LPSTRFQSMRFSIIDVRGELGGGRLMRSDAPYQ
jgi:hypothetical protein